MPTTIQVSDEFKNRLEDEKRDGESHEACLKRLIDGGELDEKEVREIVRDEVEKLRDP